MSKILINLCTTKQSTKKENISACIVCSETALKNQQPKWKTSCKDA